MKPVWLWIIFFLVYGLFSMKSEATDISPVGSRAAMGIGAQSPVSSIREGNS